MMKMYKRICIQRMKCRRRLILCCVATEEMPEALDNCMAGYLCPMPTASSNYIIFANGPYLMHLALFCWQSLSDAAGIIILQFGIPILFHSTMSFLCWALQIPVLDTPELRIRLNGNLSNKHHVLSPKNRGSWSRKSHSVEKTAIFEIFGNLLSDRWLHGFLSVNKRFTKSEFARGKVLVHER